MSIVSIIIPFYNEERTLPGCLDAVLAQTYRNLEIILVDGASTDGSAAVCASYAARDGRIKIVRQATKNGIAGGRNAGLAAVSGDYIQFVDADDLVPPDLTMALVKAMTENRCDLVATGYEYVAMRNGEPYIEVRVPEIVGAVTPEQYVARCSSNKKVWYDLVAALWCKLLRTDIVRKNGITFDEAAPPGEDFPFMMRYLSHCGEVFAMQSPCYRWIIETPDTTPEELTTGNKYKPTAVASAMHCGRIFEDVFAHRLAPADRDACRGRLANFLLIMLIILCRRDATLSRREILQALSDAANSPMVRTWFQQYRPAPGESRAIPLLLKMRLINLLFWVCRRKADKRYGAYYAGMYGRKKRAAN